MSVSTGNFLDDVFPGQDELFARIMEKATPLSDHPEICTHYWNPTLSASGSFPRGQVRGKCRASRSHNL